MRQWKEERCDRPEQCAAARTEKVKRLSDLTYGIVGMGLMGGSLGKAVRENVLCVPSCGGRIFGADKSGASLSLAERQHIIDRPFSISETDEMLAQCDVVFVCLYPHDTAEFLISRKNAFKPGSVVTDISGVKAEIFSRLDEIMRSDVDFIPGHPMAGSEKEGFAHSDGSIFRGHNYIVMPLERTKSESLALFKQLISCMGFSRIVETDARTHDHKVAFTSQLCHVIAGALVDSAEDPAVTAFGGGSFEDLTRIAMINAPLWAELFLANRTELLSCIEAFESSLRRLTSYIAGNDRESLEQYLADVREKRISMGRTEVTA